MTTLKGGDFAGLATLNLLDLSAGTNREACGLTDLPDGIFRGLPRLTRLVLSDNHLDGLRASMFDGLDSLATLEVRAANLAALPEGVFRHLPALSRLDLSENRLTAIPPRLFALAPRLTSLDLADNELAEIPAGVFEGLSRLQLLALAGNPGAPFPLTLGLEDASGGELAVRVVLPTGSPFPMIVELQARRGTLSQTSVTLDTGQEHSQPVTVTSSDDAAVTVSLTAPAMPVDPDSSSDPQQCDTPDAGQVPCFTGFEIVAGDNITIGRSTFVIRSGDNADTAKRVVESLNTDPLLKADLEGHVLSPASAADPETHRARLGLPGAGSDFADASSLTDKLQTITTIHFRRGERGHGAGWSYAGILSYTDWVDGVFFAATFKLWDVESMIPFVVGVPTAANPVATGVQSTAVWSGTVAGRDPDDVGHLSGDAKLTYDFATGELDAVFESLAYHSGGVREGTAIDDISWDDIAVTNGLFGSCSGSGDCIRGRFFDDHEGTEAASVGGVFRHGTLLVAFGAVRE